MGIKEVITPPRSPWQNPYVEGLIGSIGRECLDHTIIFNGPRRGPNRAPGTHLSQLALGSAAHRIPGEPALASC